MARQTTLGTLLTLLTLGGVAACTGRIGDSVSPWGSGSGSGGASSGSSSGTGIGRLVTPECMSAPPNPGRSPIRRLDTPEYVATITDLLGVNTDLVRTFPPDQIPVSQTFGFSNNADALAVSDQLGAAYRDAAEAFASAAVANLAHLLPCDPVAVGNDACAKQFISDFGRRAFRRPLTADENARYFTLYTTGSTAPLGSTFAEGIELALESFLQSPHFLYRVEHGLPTAAPTDTVAQVTQFELATRLAYFFWGSTPDTRLLDAAQTNALGTQPQIEAQIQRMLQDPRAKSVVATFHTEWLNLGGIPGLLKDATMFPEWKQSIAFAMFDEAQAFVDHVFWEDGKSDTLFSAHYTYDSPELAAFYGFSSPGPQGRVDVNPAQRAGILTLGGILANNAKQDQTSPVIRGKYVREALLCQPINPPANANFVAPAVAPGLTTRERFAQHEKDPKCAGCHKLMDGMGVGFEHYDALGRWRDKDQGLVIDDSGDIINTTDIDGTFHGGADLADKLAQSEDVRQCVVKQWFRYASGRAEEKPDTCTIQRLYQSFEDSKHDMRDLRVRIATSDAFRYRSLQGGGK
jgi:hypothetical protein